MGRHWIHPGDELKGMCYGDSKLYTVEKRQGDRTHMVVTYRVAAGRVLELLDTTGVGPRALQPRTDQYGRYVYVPHSDNGCVLVLQWTGKKLLVSKTLTCVTNVLSISVTLSRSLYVISETRSTVFVVDVTLDRVTAEITSPDSPQATVPHLVATLGDLVAVCNGDTSVAVCHSGNCRPSKAMPCPDDFEKVVSMTTDGHSHFVLTDKSRVVLVMDVNGNVIRKIGVPPEFRSPVDSIVVEGQIWVGCRFGDIAVLST